MLSPKEQETLNSINATLLSDGWALHIAPAARAGLETRVVELIMSEEADELELARVQGFAQGINYVLDTVPRILRPIDETA